MIKRFVKMQFRPGNEENFKMIFRSSRDLILGFEGCRHVELLQDLNDPTIFFTFSLWENEPSLNAYRNSELFAGVWATTKALFSERAQAWSLTEPELSSDGNF